MLGKPFVSSLRGRFVLTYVLGLFLPVTLSLVLLYALGIAPAIRALEEVEAQRRLEGARRLLETEEARLFAHARDYATWDDTYAVVDAPDPAWLEENITDWVPKTVGVDGALLADAKGNIVYDYGQMTRRIGAAWLDHLHRSAMKGGGRAGLISGQGQLLLVAFAPILHTNEQGPPNGLYLVAKTVGNDLPQALGSVLGDAVCFYADDRVVASWDPFGLRRIPPVPARDKGQVTSDTVRTERLDGQYLVAYGPLCDLRGQPIATLGVVRNRTVAHRARTSAMGIAGALVLLGLFFTLVVAHATLKWVVRPLEHLVAQVHDFEDGHMDHPFTVKAVGEVSELARAFEKMRASVSGLLRDLRDRERDLREANARLTELATTDTLTGLRTRRYLEEWLAVEVARCERFGHDLACLMADIDDFKRVNDRHGHPVGDQVLTRVAEILRTKLRGFDLAFRYGGEEFLVLLPQAGAEQAKEVAERIRQAVAAEPWAFNHSQDSITISIGVATLRGIPPGPGRGLDLVERADRALYEAKRAGRNRVTLFEEAASAARGGPPY